MSLTFVTGYPPTASLWSSPGFTNQSPSPEGQGWGATHIATYNVALPLLMGGPQQTNGPVGGAFHNRSHVAPMFAEPPFPPMTQWTPWPSEAHGPLNGASFTPSVPPVPAPRPFVPFNPTAQPFNGDYFQLPQIANENHGGMFLPTHFNDPIELPPLTIQQKQKSTPYSRRETRYLKKLVYKIRKGTTECFYTTAEIQALFKKNVNNKRTDGSLRKKIEALREQAGYQPIPRAYWRDEEKSLLATIAKEHPEQPVSEIRKLFLEQGEINWPIRSLAAVKKQCGLRRHQHASSTQAPVLPS